MSIEISIPKLGITMEEGTLSEWLVADGDAVTTGQPLYVLETDKTENEIESPASGVIALRGQLGETYAVGAVIATIA
jgi:pyruvate/2-oxoglutarate dehydrogenase complex dihydrolipoamide acyltransferase (E2) component